MTPEQKTKRLAELGILRGRHIRREINIRQLVAQHPEAVPTEALLEVLDGPAHTEEKSC